MEIVTKIKELLLNYSLCDNCLGRQFGNLATGLTNKDRGITLKTMLLLINDKEMKTKIEPKNSEVLIALSRSGHKPSTQTLLQRFEQEVEIKTCYLCNNIFNEVFFANLAEEILKKVDDTIFSTFLVGSIFPGELLEKEDNLRNLHNLEFSESLKSEFNREFGKYLLDKRFKDKDVDFNTPELVFVVNMSQNEVELKRNSLFIYGRYKKLERGIPQATWHCRICRGKGCENCNNSGLMYKNSVQLLIEKPLFKITGSKYSKFHGSGREDIDALMLGTGRPFVIELVNPKKYKLDLDIAIKNINSEGKDKIEVILERIVKKSEVRKLKTNSTKMRKKYRMDVEAELSINMSQDELNIIAESFKNQIIKQNTPTRVLHRRADLTRNRTVYDLTIRKKSDNELELYIIGQGGLYVKELVSGDEGRTKPNLSERLGIASKCIALDVISIYNIEEE